MASVFQAIHDLIDRLARMRLARLDETGVSHPRRGGVKWKLLANSAPDGLGSRNAPRLGLLPDPIVPFLPHADYRVI